MRKLTVVGGGLTGVLTALEAHRLGYRDITLHERFEDLGGIARTRTVYGQEIRNGTIYFGPPGDPMVELLQSHGAEFEVFDNRYGSVSLGRDGRLLFTPEFGGPAIESDATELRGPYEDSLASRIAAYPAEIADVLTRYTRWHLSAEPELLHENAALPMAVNRVYAPNADLPQMLARKAAEPLYDELYGVPHPLSGRRNNLVASVPKGGFGALFDQCRRALDSIRVTVQADALYSPRELLQVDPAQEVVIWAANPLPLLKLAGLPPAQMVKKSFASYVHRCRAGTPAPFYAQNFTCRGSVFRAYVYESGGETLVTAECVAEVDEADLRREVAELMEGFGGVELGAFVSATVAPRWIYHSLDAMQKLAAVRAWAAREMGDAFIAGAWEPYPKGEKFAEVRAALAESVEARPARATA